MLSGIDKHRRFSLPMVEIIVVAGLYLSSTYSFLLFHTMVELFSIIVACCVFILAWNTRRLLDNSYFLLLGVGYLFISVPDLIHALSYKGMGVFTHWDANLPTQLWIAARYMESLTLLAAPFFISRKTNPAYILYGYLMVTMILLSSIFYWGTFPAAFIEGQGLTWFKKISEYIISTILVVSIALLVRKRYDLDTNVFWYMLAAITLTIVSELTFTFYISVYGLSNLIGHYLKIGSVYFLYKAIVQTGLSQPYDLLFRSLKQKERDLRFRLNFERLISDISSKFMTIRASQIDPEIDETLKKVGRFVEVDGCYLFRFTHQMTKMSMTHLWRNKHLSINKGELQNLEADTMPWWLQQLAQQKPVVVSSVNKLPAGAAVEKKIVASLGIQSLVDVPLFYLGKTIGAVGFICVKKEHNWSQNEINLLQLVGQIIINALIRKENLENLQAAHNKLEYRVQERTSELVDANLLLQQKIIEHEEMGHKLQRTMKMLQTVFDGTKDLLILLGPDMETKIINTAAVRYYGADAPPSRIGQPCYQTFKNRHSPCEGCAVPHAIQEAQNRTVERQGFMDPDKSELVDITPIPNERGETTNVIVRISDITERKIYEKQIIQNEKMASLGVLTTSVAHEINNPNNFISFNLPILKEYIENIMPIVDRHACKIEDLEICNIPYEDFQKDIIRLLENIEKGSERIHYIVSSLKEFSRTRRRQHVARTDLKAVFEKAVTMCQTEIKRSVQAIHLEIPDELPLILTEPHSLEQVLINLLVNAAHAADKKDSFITLKLALGDTWENHTIIKVIDNGSGIENKNINKIFDPFFTTKPVGKGTGLGLYVSHNIIEHLGGRIEVDSTPGQGSKFTITLPDIEHRKEERELDA